jgi:hypothetical protein
MDHHQSSKNKQRSILDFAVRPDHVPPPLCLPVLLGWLSLGAIINTSLILVFFWYGFRKWGFVWGFCCMWLPCCEIIMQLGDVCSSQAPSRNIQNLRRHGYSDWTILAYHQINLIQSQIISFIVCTVICNDPRLDDSKYLLDRLGNDWFLIIIRILVTLACSEAAFLVGHTFLHTHPYWMKLHIFHHCCTTPSFSTNLLFHPVDLMIEFTGPLLCVLGLHYMAWQQDSVTLLATYTIFQLWYSYDHDEHMNLYHIQHHQQCDSLYSIYIHTKGAPSKNLLQKYMRDK